jgi:hypothetical protein
MKVINDTPKGISIEECDFSDIVSYMEKKHQSSKRFKENNTNSFYVNNMTTARRI